MINICVFSADMRKKLPKSTPPRPHVSSCYYRSFTPFQGVELGYAKAASFRDGFFAACVCLLLALSLALPLASAAAFDNAEDTKHNRNSNALGNGLGNHAASSFNPYAHNSWQWTLFNATASFIGLPGLVSPVDGLQDEGLGFHADGTTRRAGGADSASSYNGQRAGSYMRSGQMYGMNALNRPWLYDDIMGVSRGADGRLTRMGDEHSGRRDSRGYGSTLFGDGSGNMTHSLMQRGISAGMGFANSTVESSILGLMGKDSPYGNGKARLNFNWYIDEKGTSRFGGEGDVLWPLYDSLHTTVYTQIGARSMYGGGDSYGPDRWIGNLGVGQRWFPGAKWKDDGTTVDSGSWMVGYNAFYDHDITRGHQRGGVGVEAQYDWLKLASNWYLPLSDWKDSKDFDGNFVQERAAQGWDLRAKGYLPFYREIAVTGSFTQWYGDHVGMFGPSKLEKDPKIWSYGLEYTPVPAITAFVNQRQSERGRADTELGLRFTYNFGMNAEDQFKSARVAEMRTVHGSRHDFVDRENKIILEYRAKNNFHIEYLGKAGDNTFRFRIKNGLNKYVGGQQVTVSGGSGVTLAAAPNSIRGTMPNSMPNSMADTGPASLLAKVMNSIGEFFVASAHAVGLTKTYITNGDGTFMVALDKVTSLPAAITIQVGNTTQSIVMTEAVLSTNLIASPANIGNSDTSTITLNGAPTGATVVWSMSGGPSGANFSSSGLTATYTAPATGTGPATIQAVVDGTDTYTCTVQVNLPSISIAAVSNGSSFSGGVSTASVTVLVKNLKLEPANNATVTWSVLSANNTSPAMASGWGSKKTGLAWGSTHGGVTSGTGGNELAATQDSAATDASGKTTQQISDIVGERTVTLRASVIISGTAYTVDQAVTFGDGPLNVFKTPESGTMDWDTAYNACNGSTYLGANHTTGWSSGAVVGGTKMPSRTELQAVSASGSGGLKGAGFAAGWPDDWYWTGEAYGANRAFVVGLDVGYDIGNLVGINDRVACRR